MQQVAVHEHATRAERHRERVAHEAQRFSATNAHTYRTLDPPIETPAHFGTRLFRLHVSLWAGADTLETKRTSS